MRSLSEEQQEALAEILEYAIETDLAYLTEGDGDISGDFESRADLAEVAKRKAATYETLAGAISALNLDVTLVEDAINLSVRWEEWEELENPNVEA